MAGMGTGETRPWREEAMASSSIKCSNEPERAQKGYESHAESHHGSSHVQAEQQGCSKAQVRPSMYKAGLAPQVATKEVKGIGNFTIHGLIAKLRAKGP